jgi:hypothetical protein
LEKPGRDPRPAFKAAAFMEGVETLNDLKPGMVLEGAVTNVAAFGAFVDIGVHQDGLVHVSAMSKIFVKDPREVVKPGDIVRVKVLEVDAASRPPFPGRYTFSMNIVPAKKLPVAVLRHPLGACQMALPGVARPFGLACSINVQYPRRHFGPISALRVSIQKSLISDIVFLVVGREKMILGCLIRDMRIERWVRHDVLPS